MQRSLVGLILLLIAVLVAGCNETSTTAPEKQEFKPLGTQFDPSACGRIEGSVLWQGPAPVVPPFRSFPTPSLPPPYPPERDFPNPNAPAIDAHTNGVGDVVVFLREVDTARSRPWHHEPARVEVEDHVCRIRQGDRMSRAGIVRTGDDVELLARGEGFWSLRGRGAAFFSMAVPGPEARAHRRLSQPGIVELSGNGGRYWMRAYLFVADHPYWTRTDTGGRFSLEQVPEGDYELICWLPNWTPESVERDINTTLTARMTFRPPASIVRRITVRRGAVSAVDFHLAQSDFGVTSK